MNKTRNKNYERVMSRVHNNSRVSLKSDSLVMRHGNPSVCVAAKPSVSNVSSSAFSELPTVLNDYVHESSDTKGESSVKRSRVVKPRRTIKSLDTSKSPPRTVSKAREKPRNLRTLGSAPAVSRDDGWSEVRLRECYSSRSHTRLKELKDEIKAYHETDKLIKLRSDLYKKCGVLFDEDGRVAEDKAVQADEEIEKVPEVIRFPKTPRCKDEWTLIIQQDLRDEEWLPTQFSRVCSAHFKEDDFHMTPLGRRKIKPHATPAFRPTSEQSQDPDEQKETGPGSPLNDVYVSDTESIFDTSGEIYLKKQLTIEKDKKEKYRKDNLKLKKQNRYLKSKNIYLRQLVRALKSRNHLNKENFNELILRAMRLSRFHTHFLAQ